MEFVVCQIEPVLRATEIAARQAKETRRLYRQNIREVFDEMYRKIIDISMTISKDMPIYKGRPAKKPVIEIDSDFNTGSVYETRVGMNMHTGTHLDMPLHMSAGGKDLDSLDLSKVITKCKVFDLTAVEEKITRDDLEGKGISAGDFILLKTKNSFEDILEGEFVYLDKTGAEHLADKRVIGVGIDALGIERNQPAHETHLALLDADIVILEGLRLEEADEGEYFLIAVPIKIAGAEAAPVRALLLTF